MTVVARCVFWSVMLNWSFSNLFGILYLDILKVLGPVLKLADLFLKYCMLDEHRKRNLICQNYEL